MCTRVCFQEHSEVITSFLCGQVNCTFVAVSRSVVLLMNLL